MYTYSPEAHSASIVKFPVTRKRGPNKHPMFQLSGASWKVGIRHCQNPVHSACLQSSVNRRGRAESRCFRAQQYSEQTPEGARDCWVESGTVSHVQRRLIEACAVSDTKTSWSARASAERSQSVQSPSCQRHICQPQVSRTQWFRDV